jgi:hypothetical protein
MKKLILSAAIVLGSVSSYVAIIPVSNIANPICIITGVEYTS